MRHFQEHLVPDLFRGFVGKHTLDPMSELNGRLVVADHPEHEASGGDQDPDKKQKSQACFTLARRRGW
jgi:hypothetical protein